MLNRLHLEEFGRSFKPSKDYGVLSEKTKKRIENDKRKEDESRKRKIVEWIKDGHHGYHYQ